MTLPSGVRDQAHGGDAEVEAVGELTAEVCKLAEGIATASRSSSGRRCKGSRNAQLALLMVLAANR